MDKLEWKKLCNMTKSASGKKRLSKKECGELMAAQIALGRMKQLEPNWKGKTGITSIKSILANLKEGI